MEMPWAGTTSTPSLKGVNLVRTFGDGSARRAALQEVSIDLFPGQIVLLMGPSGSGKSTLLAILSGLLEPDSGQVLADDDGVLRDVWQMTAKEREGYRRAHAGFIFQGYNLFPALTARQQLEIVLKWGEGASGGDARRRADDMLDKLGLAKNKHKKPAQLSGGEKQRVAIGRALVKNPSFMFADEPTGAGLGERAEGDRAAAGRRPPAGRVGAVRLPRPPHPAVRGRVLPPGRRAPGAAPATL